MVFHWVVSGWKGGGKGTPSPLSRAQAQLGRGSTLLKEGQEPRDGGNLPGGPISLICRVTLLVEHRSVKTPTHTTCIHKTRPTGPAFHSAEDLKLVSGAWLANAFDVFVVTGWLSAFLPLLHLAASEGHSHWAFSSLCPLAPCHPLESFPWATGETHLPQSLWWDLTASAQCTVSFSVSSISQWGEKPLPALLCLIRPVKVMWQVLEGLHSLRTC